MADGAYEGFIRVIGFVLGSGVLESLLRTVSIRGNIPRFVRFVGFTGFPYG